MTNRELVNKAFHNEPTDRIPVGFWFHFLEMDQFNGGLAHPELMEKNYAGHKKFIEEFHPDFVKIITDGLFTRPAVTMPAVYEARDLYKFEPLPHNHPYFAACLKLAKTVRGYAGDDTMVFYNIFSPIFNLSKYLNDSADLFTVDDLMHQDPDAVKFALDVLGKDMSYLAELLMTEGGMDGIYLSVNNSHRTIPLEPYAKYVAPSEIAILETANRFGDNQILHICGYRGRQNILAAYRDYPAAVFNWAVHEEDMTLAEGKKYFHGKAVIGGFDQMPGSLINAGSKEDIQAYVEKLLADCGKVGVIVGADCTVPSDTPIEHLEWVREKANELSK